MIAVPPKYEFIATNAQEIYTLLQAAEQLLDAHLTMLNPGGSGLRVELRKATPAHMTLRLDLSPILDKVTEVAQLNEQLNALAAEHKD
ncbi:hypothetical protein OTB20_19420 [Streptomyces sp. H27-H1]|uniref:hypothetical protein n=1 Tax=Streptomyces sp. H27-H1 TaxID=2996461 RepID=UPI0022700403|nr:hypothetical protein [Streptomyces sp. H27-H1]MCY0928327.1 hypothetical protein [Streptomyces sp. H27-H1]